MGQNHVSVRATTSALYSQTRSINSPALLFRDCAFKRQKFSFVGLAFCTAASLVRSNGVRFSLCHDLFGCLDRVLHVTTGILNVVLAGFILSLVSIPQAYLRRTSDVNGSNFSVSRLLCSLGNACSSKPPKYTFKSRSTRLTSLLTLYQNKIRKLKHQSRCNEIRRLHLAGN